MKSKRRIKRRAMDNIDLGRKLSMGVGELRVLRQYEDTVLIYKLFKA